MAFLKEKLAYNPSIPVINLINYKKKKATEVYTFASSMLSESFIIGNMSVFEDFNVNQIDINKMDPCWNN